MAGCFMGNVGASKVAGGGGGGSLIALRGTQVKSPDGSNGPTVSGVSYQTGDTVFCYIVVCWDGSVTSISGGTGLSSWSKVTDGTTVAAYSNAFNLSQELWKATVITPGTYSSQTVNVVYTDAAGTDHDITDGNNGYAIVFALTNVVSVNKVVLGGGTVSGGACPCPSVTTSAAKSQILVLGATFQGFGGYCDMDCRSLTGYTELGFVGYSWSASSAGLAAGLQTSDNSSTGTFSPGNIYGDTSNGTTYRTMSIALIHL